MGGGGMVVLVPESVKLVSKVIDPVTYVAVTGRKHTLFRF